MKNKKLIISFIVILSIITILLTIFFVGILTNKKFKFLNFSTWNFGYKISNKLVINKTFDTIFEEIQIDAEASDIQIKEGKENQIQVKIYGEKNQTKVNETNTKLNITSSNKSCIGICFNQTISKIEVYIPKSYKNKIDITNQYGDVQIAEFIDLTVDIEMNAGDLSIESIKTGKIKNDYGDIEIKKYAKKLDIEESCGDVEIGEVDNSKVINNYGDITIHKVNNSLDIKDDCGDIEINSVNLNENSSVYNDYGNIEIGSTNEVYIKAKTDLGDVEINHNYQKSDITLTLNNSCGDITVEN